MSTAAEVGTVFTTLWNDIEQEKTFPQKRPLLAHYTSIGTLESIMRNDEIWFSNPLFMNDLQELRFGIVEGANAFRQHKGIESACGDSGRYETLSQAFEHNFDEFSNKHAIDTYVFCLAEHDPGNSDGLLSMWRGYGGNGSGVALLFDTRQLIHIEGMVPLIISSVTYASELERLGWIDRKLTEFAALLTEYQIPRGQLYIAAYQLFERIKMFALFTKHHGFSEEREWRVVYLRERDQQKKIEDMLHYAVGPRGIEPKLKFQVRPIEGYTNPDLSLEKIVAQIILGPTTSHNLALESVRRMLVKLGKDVLADRVTISSTPFRP
jgi:hypothetical protein